MRVCLFLFFVLFATALFGQTTVDSIAIVKQVDSLIQVSRELVGKQDWDQTLEVLARAESLVLQNMGEESAEYGSCCHIHAFVNKSKGNYREAEAWYLKAIDIRAKVLGKADIDYAHTLNNLAILYAEIGNYKNAEPLHLEALNIRRKVLGKEHPNYVSSLNNLGILYINMGNYEKAEPLLLECKGIYEKMLNKEDPGYGTVLTTLGVIYQNMGNYEKAEPLFLKALDNREKTLGKKNPDYAGSLINLASLNKVMGNYEKAEPLLIEAKDIFEVQLNILTHPFYLNCLRQLASLYTEFCIYEKAKPLTIQALEIQEKATGKEHPAYAASLEQLASLYASMGSWKEAESPLFEALALEENILGKENPTYATTLCNVASFYAGVKDYEKAEQYFLQAKSIQAKVLGRDHPDFGFTLSALASTYRDKGEYGKAEPLLFEAKAIQEKVFGKVHADYIACLNKLADINVVKVNYETAEPLIAEIASINRSLISNALHHLSEMEMQYYLKRFSKDQDNALCFAQMSKGNKSAPVCYDNSLFYKGFLLNAAQQAKRLTSLDSAAIEKTNTLKGFERRLSSQYSLPGTERDSSLVINLEEKANAIEKDLARTVAGYGAAMHQVNWQEVRASLNAGEAAIEFVHYIGGPDSVMYAAMVLRPGDEHPQFIPLFEQKQLDSLLQSKSGKARKADYVNAVYSFKPQANNLQSSKTLYELLWKPLEKDLASSPVVDLSKAGIKTIYFSPSGLLHRLNMNAIPINENETLSDRYHLVELGSTRQLVISPESNRSTTDAGQALLFGGVQYDPNTDSIHSQNIDIESSITGTRGELNFSYTDSTDRGGSWNYLKWTDKEVTALEPILKSAHIQTTLRKGYTATEEAFKSIGSNGKSPRILHIATHGYFFPDQVQVRKTEFGIRNDAEPVFKMSEHPMIRSGLILAGGNHAWKTGKPFREGMEDGILTAYEISQMDLSNTELVVLSACETGLGDIQGNEGVYGLQRAFKIAGAKYLIMSLWQVPDFQTQELMTAFYTNWLTKQMSIPDAFRAAQQTMREKYEHPYFWAGFVLVE